MVCFAFPQTILKYGLSVWGNSSCLNEILILQKQAMGSTINDSKNVEGKETSDNINKQDTENQTPNLPEWSPDQEVLLLYSLLGHKPVGPNKHFYMYVIHERLSNAMNKKISSKDIWDKLNKMYDLEALDEAESEQSAVDRVNINFKLPKKEFKKLMKARLNETETKTKKGKGSLPVKIKSDGGSVHVPRGVRKDPYKRSGKKKEALLLKENIRDHIKKETPKKKEVTKELKKRGQKEDDKREPIKKSTQDYKKDIGVKEATPKANRRDSIAKYAAELTKKELENKKVESNKKSPTQRGGSNNRSEMMKQTTLEMTKRADSKTLRTDTPKSPRVEALKKEASMDKTPEKGSKLRARERKPTESETAGTKRERSRETAANKSLDMSSEEPPAKKAKVAATKVGRPTRNSIEPQQKQTTSPVNSVQKRRGRP